MYRFQRDNSECLSPASRSTKKRLVANVYPGVHLPPASKSLSVAFLRDPRPKSSLPHFMVPVQCPVVVGFADGP